MVPQTTQFHRIEMLLEDMQRRLIRVESRLVTLANHHGVDLATVYGAPPPRQQRSTFEAKGE